MRFDLSGCGAGLDESAKDLLELGPFAERLGYDGLWINEEHFGQGSRVCFSPILVATALAVPALGPGTGVAASTRCTCTATASS